MKKMLLFFLTVFMVVSTSAQVAGDYGSAATGDWGTTGANWLVFVASSDWSDATVAPGAPSSSKNVWIRPGHTVNMEAGSKNCKNITIQSGGTLITGATGNTITVSGDALIDGTMGSGTVAPLFQFGVSGKIYGSGTCYVSKIRANAAGLTMTVDMNVTIISASGSVINCNGKGGDMVFEVKAGRTLTLPTGGYISVASNSSTSDPTGTVGNFTINIYGTVTVPVSSGGGINLANQATYTTTLNVFSTGIVNTGRLSALAAGAGISNITISNGGSIVLTFAITNDIGKATTAINGTFDCNNAISTAFGTATVSSTGKLRLQNGTFPTGTVNLNSGSTVEYYGSSLYTIPASPSTYEKLISNNSGGLTVGGPITVNGTLTLSAGNLDNSTNQITLGPSGSVVNAGGTISQAPLPVELTSFTATARGKNIELLWKTATEANNSGFEIERKSIDQWNKIGFVEGSGTTNTPKEYHFVDAVHSGKTYLYRLKQIDRDGKFEYSPIVEATTVLTAEDYQLTQNYPNPFNPSTTFSFAMKNAEQTTVKVYNLVGQEVATLFNGIANPNQVYTMKFDGKDLSSGIYFYSLRSNSRNEMKKMMLLK